MAIREPWLMGQPHQQVIAEAMRLRARLIPYLYTGLHLNNVKGTPFLTPLYYEYPKDPQAYKAPNTYLLGPRMVVSPVVTPLMPALNRAKTSLYLPQGQWIDFFTGIETKGGRLIEAYSPIEHLPVYLRKGSILPLAVWEDQDDPSANPNTLWIKVYPDVSASYTLIEDDNVSQDYLKKEIFVTEFALQDKTFTIKTDKKEKAYLPLLRNYRIEIVGYHVKGNFTSTLSETGTLIELKGIDLIANTTLKFTEMTRLDPKVLVRQQLKIALANVKANVSVKSDFLSAFDSDTLESAYQKHKKEKELIALVRALTDTQTG
jgi:alpha-glucosidase (family GH31 glycosyl hydrolase)